MPKVSKRRSYAKLAGDIYRGVRTGYGMYKRARRVYNSFTGKTNKGKDFAPLTSQHDYRVVYRKRSMGKRKRRRYVKSVKRFQSQIMRGLPSRIFQYVHALEYLSAPNCSYYFGAFMGLYSQNIYDNNFTQALNNITQGANCDAKIQTGFLRLDHASLRVVLRNTGLTPVDVDVYKVVCIRDIPLDIWIPGTRIESMYTTQKNLLRQAQGMDFETTELGVGVTTLQQNAGTSSVTQAVGDSLWNNPPFLKYWKIVKQFKIQLPSGNTTEFMTRNSRNRKLMCQEFIEPVVQGNIQAKKYVTEGYIFNINGRATTIGEGVVQFEPSQVMCEQYVRYNIKVVPGGSPTLVYDGI